MILLHLGLLKMPFWKIWPAFSKFHLWFFFESVHFVHFVRFKRQSGQKKSGQSGQSGHSFLVFFTIQVAEILTSYMITSKQKCIISWKTGISLCKMTREHLYSSQLNMLSQIWRDAGENMGFPLPISVSVVCSGT
jgi:hypothetical protein